MGKNCLRYTCIWSFIVLLGLLLMFFLPNLKVGKCVMRRVDLLSDLRLYTDTASIVDSNLLSLPLLPKPIFVDSCPKGMTCIQDYSDSTLRGMNSFYKALDTLAIRPRLVRVAVFGDSFIEADILTADLREMLQNRYGGCGVGYVTITSMTNGYRPTVYQHFGGWRSYSPMDPTGFNRAKQGLSCHYFLPRGKAYVELKGTTKYATHLDTCNQASMFFYTKGGVTMTVGINGNSPETSTFLSANSLQMMKVQGRIGSVRWEVQKADSTIFYGLAMDGDRGVSVDNFSLRGSSGVQLHAIPMQTMKGFNKLRPYDLIILQYGLNIATEHGWNYEIYRQKMHEVICHIKEAFPQAGILLLGVGDRDHKTENGDFRTMPSVKNLIPYQQLIAADNAIAYWSMFEAMGGEGSMAKLVQAKPPLANYDYTHLNFRGGKYMAGLLYKALIYGKEQYDRQRSLETK